MAVASLAGGGVSPLAAQQTGTVRGTVVSSETAEPLVRATVVVQGTVRSGITNAAGVYQVTLSAGTYTLRARYIGFESLDQEVVVQAGETVTLDFQLIPGAIIVDELVAVGSRTARTVTETPVPIDVISAEEIAEAGYTEVNQILAVLAPSFNASHQTIGDGTDHINPASLRGLGPDQVLVLLNGKRRHQSGLVHVNGTFGRGTVGVDLNSIPTTAIERIEVLRDGASAQYGSDAIAGVINIVLRQQTESIEITSQAGVTGEGDGEQVKAGVNYGFEVGDGGYFNVTGEYLDRERTNRSGAFSCARDTRPPGSCNDDIFPGISGAAATDAELASRGLTREDFSMKTGQGAAEVGQAFYNTAVPLGQSAEFYSFGGLSYRNGVATGFYRLPSSERQVVPELHPNGFLPQIHTGIRDGAFSAGVRGVRSGWDIDFSVTHGRNSFQFNIENSNNASLGVSSPITFDAGTLSFAQTVGNLDVVRLVDTKGTFKALSLVAGAEFRIENYEIQAGEVASYQLGNGGPIPGVDFDTTSTGAPKEGFSSVFPGFQPSNEVDRNRNSIGAYLGFESQITDEVVIDVGGRFENYSDFGSRVTGKVAGRFEVAQDVALRGAVSNGFRAPSLQQAWFNSESTQFVLVGGSLQPDQVLTANNLSGVTAAFGFPPLEEETSVSVSAGFTARPTDNLSITADFYHVSIDDRIVLSSRFSTSDPTVAAILAPFQGVGQAQFFTNAVDTKTTGVDVVVQYATVVGDGTLNLTGSVNITDTEVQNVNVPAGVAAKFPSGGIDAVAETIFNREERNRLEDALPHEKFTASARYARDFYSILVRSTYYGSIEYKPTSSANDETFGGKALFDVEVSVDVVPGLNLTAGAVNIFNTFPDEHQLDQNRDRERFVYSRRVTQFGMNGGFYYGKVKLRL
jgi:iron complex outermembrane receptor protein